MRLRVVADDDARVEHPCRVAQRLELAHHRHEFAAVLPLDEGRHDAARAVLGLERSTLRKHELDDLVGDGRVAGDALRGVKALGEQEVDVAVFRMPEDHGVLIPVPREHVLKRLAGRQQVRHRYRHIFEQGRCAARAGLRNGRVEALAHVPERRPHDGISRERERCGKGEPRDDVVECLRALVELSLGRRMHFDE